MAVSQLASGTQLHPLRMLSCLEKNYIRYGSRELVVAAVMLVRAGTLWMLTSHGRNQVLACPQQEQAVFRKLQASKQASTAKCEDHPQGLVEPQGDWNDAFCSYNGSRFTT